MRLNDHVAPSRFAAVHAMTMVGTALAMPMKFVGYTGPIGSIVLQYRKPVLVNKKSTGRNAAHVFYFGIPLAFVLDKFYGLCRSEKAAKASECKEYGKLVRQLFLKLTVIYENYCINVWLRNLAPGCFTF